MGCPLLPSSSRTEQANLTRVWSTCCPNPSSSPEWSSLAVGFFVPNEAGRRGSHPRGLRSSHITWYLYVNQASIPKTYHALYYSHRFFNRSFFLSRTRSLIPVPDNHLPHALFRRDVQTIIQYPRWSHRQVEAHQDYLSRTVKRKMQDTVDE